VLTKTLISIGIFLSLFSYAKADYEVFDINTIPPNTAVPSATYTQTGVGLNQSYAIEYVADSTVTQFDRITLPFCRYLGANGGEVYLELRSSTTTGPIIASSTIAVNSGNISSTGCTTLNLNATTTTWVLNQNVQWLPDVEIYFIFKPVGTNPASTFYFSHEIGGTNGIALGMFPFAPFTYLGDYYNTAMTGYALGVAPVAYNASSSNVVCDTFDLGCYTSQAFAWAFYPDIEDLEQFKTLNFASSSPFGYIYDMDDAYQSFMTGLNATTSNFKITLDMTTLGQHADVFRSVGTSSITVFDVCWVNRELGELPSNSFRDRVLPMVVFMMWIGLGWLFYSVAHRIW